MSVRTDLLAISSLAGGVLLCASATVVGVVLGLPALAVGVCLVVVSLADRAGRYTTDRDESGHGTESGRNADSGGVP
jgi:multisubunit Na+/H+ antiporter MnhC subunit